MTIKSKVLCLPAGMPRSVEYLRSSDLNKIHVIGASSEKYDVSRQFYKSWLYIPHISDPNFTDFLINALSKAEINHIFTPHQVIWNFINELILKNTLTGVSLINSQPILTELTPYHQCMLEGRELFANTTKIASTSVEKQRLLPIEYASLLSHVRSIPGEMDEQKIAALTEIIRYCPEGDIVEIGVLWGKSAFVLSFLSKKHQIGSVLCIDPWDRSFLPQGSELLTKYSSETHDIEEALTIFQVNLLPYCNGDLNYLRLPSTDAFYHYSSNKTISSQVFGSTTYKGSISLLHIDGNHSYQFARLDLELWQQFVCRGGWVIMDDYCWKFGDGPQKAVDEFILGNSQRIQCSFIMGGALFFQFY